MGQKLKNEELGRMSEDQFRSSEKTPVVVVLDNVRSLHNVGSVFRTCDAFLIEEILLCGITGTPPGKEIEKTALGATKTVKWSHHTSTQDAVDHLKKRGFKVYSIEQVEGSIKLNDVGYDGEPIALVFGNEVYGVDQKVIDISDGVLEIPQLGSKHSLNISVSVGIVLWELLRRKM